MKSQWSDLKKDFVKRLIHLLFLLSSMEQLAGDSGLLVGKIFVRQFHDLC